MQNNEKFVFEQAPQILNTIPEDRMPEWGKMSAQHMVEHLGIIFMISAGRIKPKSIPESEQSKLYDLLTSKDFEFKPNTSSPALPKDPLPLHFATFPLAKEATLQAIERFRENFKDAAAHAKVEHPVFGKLSYEEWLHFHNIHLQHHFKQFGLAVK